MIDFSLFFFNQELALRLPKIKGKGARQQLVKKCLLKPHCLSQDFSTKEKVKHYINFEFQVNVYTRIFAQWQQKKKRERSKRRRRISSTFQHTIIQGKLVCLLSEAILTHPLPSTNRIPFSASVGFFFLVRPKQQVAKDFFWILKSCDERIWKKNWRITITSTSQ